MENLIFTQRLSVAAGTAGRVSVVPPTSSERYKLLSVTEVPNAASAAHSTNFCTRTPYVGGSAVATGVTTETVALAAGTPVAWELTGKGSALEITHAAPFTHRVAHSGTGVAYDCSVVVAVQVERV